MVPQIQNTSIAMGTCFQQTTKGSNNKKKNCLTYKDWCLCYIMAQFRYVWDDDDDDWTEEFSLLTYKEEGSIVHAIATKNEEMAKMKTV